MFADRVNEGEWREGGGREREGEGEGWLPSLSLPSSLVRNRVSGDGDLALSLSLWRLQRQMAL